MSVLHGRLSFIRKNWFHLTDSIKASRLEVMAGEEAVTVLWYVGQFWTGEAKRLQMYKLLIQINIARGSGWETFNYIVQREDAHLQLVRSMLQIIEHF